MPEAGSEHNYSWLLERLAPPQREILQAVAALAEAADARVFLVGGPVRDLLRDESVQDLDFTAEGDGLAFAQQLAEELGGRLKTFDRFGTAVIGLGRRGRVDVATTRSERYPEPGALPQVAIRASLEEDLRRRDFTINALAISVCQADYGRLFDPVGGRQDLEARLIRVVYRRSFEDDPTRLIRALAFAGRFDFALEAETESLLREAAKAGALATISADRRNEALRQLLQKPGAARGLVLLGHYGLLEQVGLGPALSREDADRLELVPEALLRQGASAIGPSAARAYVALLLAQEPVEAEAGVTILGLGRRQRGQVLRAVQVLRQVPKVLQKSEVRPSDIYTALQGLERGALAALWTGVEALGRERIEHYWHELRRVQPDIGGEDLRQAGRQGPEIAAGLARALQYKLDHPEASREEQLRAALVENGQANDTD